MFYNVVGDRMTIKEKREKLNITQSKLAELIGVSSRTIRRYENGMIDKFKEKYILDFLNDLNKVDETHGILKKDDIVKGISEVANKYKIDFVYLFGSYSKDNANPLSDVDLLIKTSERGLNYFGLIEEIRTTLNKKIDAISLDDLTNNKDLLNDILKEGVKIYG
ncbi:MAG: helix-turn-helix domain-containing protein [Acholeplasmataceae bacterium]|nr:helix-turn-helix domain-containing protein [Acholeplasmataceae bacterium]MCK9289851.1 helix-turn-helix domain-containing protein [Acholeplasmataceae bacterium]MCK9428345.1 helix-turn-helix domain-containing protein [Acholeplasmataceae bacterium]